MARGRKRAGVRKVTLSPECAMPLLCKAGVAIEGIPESVFGYLNCAGEIVRILARWPGAGGWRADLRFRVDGTVSLTQSICLRVEGRP